VIEDERGDAGDKPVIGQLQFERIGRRAADRRRAAACECAAFRQVAVMISAIRPAVLPGGYAERVAELVDENGTTADRESMSRAKSLHEQNQGGQKRPCPA
jgi:hypothetical protein